MMARLGRRWGLLAALASVLCAGVAWAAQEVVVTQANRSFSVREVRVARGGSIRFLNADEFLHQVFVNSAPFSFTSAEQEPGRVLDVRFPVRGVFSVRCEIHPKMALAVTVE